jgi:hypothetical protein
VTVVAIDTGRGMREAMPAVRAAVRRLRGRFEVAALGDYRCHLLQAGDRFHACGLDRSFELAMLYYARKSVTDALVFCGNGVFRDAISASHARLLGIECDGHVYTEDAFRELRRQCDVRMLYVARGVYDTGVREWETLLGERNVARVEGGRGLATALARVARG